MNNDPFKNRTIYVAGGMFGSVEQKFFRLVRPSGKDALPYLWERAQNAGHLTQHHAHVYELDRDTDTVNLVITSHWALPNVEAPATVKLHGEQLLLLRAALARGEYIDTE